MHAISKLASIKSPPYIHDAYFRPELGRRHRLSIAWWPFLESGHPNFAGNPAFRFCQRAYIKGLGYVRWNDELEQMRGILGIAPEFCAATVVISWPTKKNGKAHQGKLKSEGGAARLWTLSRATHDRLMLAQQQHGLGMVDVRVFRKNKHSVPEIGAIVGPDGNHSNLLRAHVRTGRAEKLIADAREIAKNADRLMAKSVDAERLRALFHR